MLIKWITCKVTESQKQSFSLAQEKWRPLEGIEGFLGQVGGWNQHQPLEACILTFWEGMDHYQSFMEKDHDPIFHQTGQSQSYEAISVQLFSTITDMDERNILDAIDSGQILRVANTKEIDGMTESDGMLVGVVGQSLKSSEQYVTVSLWKNEQLSLPRAHTAVLEPTWRVVKRGRQS
ncbi:YdbC family protein [Brevibacillus sp. 179-C9.3 HS]|uniref:YdbC family protein n=1 Tax=unclassified Brevibacillus TaxID=2684853 RepID=UPI0039A21479